MFATNVTVVEYTLLIKNFMLFTHGQSNLFDNFQMLHFKFISNQCRISVETLMF